MGYSEQMDSAEAPEGVAEEFSRIVSGFAALLSVGLVAGIAYWGYQLAVRDVSGVPVVRAVEGPMRIQPDDPGGDAAEHVGLAVNHVKAEGAAEDVADRLVLAPEPTRLRDEDRPVLKLGDGRPAKPAEVAPAARPAPATREATIQPAVLTVPESEIKTDTDRAVASALARALAESGEMPATPNNPVPQEAAAPAAPAASDGGLRTPRPRARIGAPAPDATVQTVSLNPAAVTHTAPQTELPVGTRLVQLGAYPTEAEAHAAWKELEGEFSDFIADKEEVVQPATSAGRTFYRLRASGFEDLADARRFCATLVAGEASCIPVVVR